MPPLRGTRGVFVFSLPTEIVADTTETTLDAAPDPTEAPAPAEAAATPPADAPRGDWRSVLRRLRDDSDAEEVEEDEDDEQDPGTEQADHATPEAREQADAKAPDAKKPDEEEGKDPWEGKPFKVTDADGRPQAIPESARFAFTADGQEKTASLDELISFAQKGVHADRKLSDQGRVVKSLETRLSHYDGLEKGFEQLLTKIAEGDEAVLTELKRAYERNQDPEVREALAAKSREDARKAAEAASGVDLEAELQAVWDDARAKFGETVAAKADEYPFLAEEDADQVVRDLYDGYLAHRGDLVERYEQAAKARDVDVGAARDLAERDALLYLTAENLFGAMRALNDRYAARLGKHAPPTAPSPQAKAEEHNRYIETKQKQGETRTLRGGGGLDPAAGKKVERPTTYRGHIGRVKSIIRRAAGD